MMARTATEEERAELGPESPWLMADTTDTRSVPNGEFRGHLEPSEHGRLVL